MLKIFVQLSLTRQNCPTIGENQHIIPLSIPPDSKISDVSEHVKRESPGLEKSTILFAFQGNLLDNNATLQNIGCTTNNFLIAFPRLIQEKQKKSKPRVQKTQINILDFITDDKLEPLIEMGFPRERAIKALLLNGLNRESAVQWLVMHQNDPSLDEPFSQNQINQVRRTFAPLVAATLNSVPNTAIDPAIKRCIEEKKCTYSYTGNKFEAQEYRSCITCDLVENKGVCISCAQVCHNGHELGPVRKHVNFYCDCGAGDGPQPCRAMASQGAAQSSEAAASQPPQSSSSSSAPDPSSSPPSFQRPPLPSHPPPPSSSSSSSSLSSSQQSSRPRIEIRNSHEEEKTAASGAPPPRAQLHPSAAPSNRPGAGIDPSSSVAAFMQQFFGFNMANNLANVSGGGVAAPAAAGRGAGRFEERKHAHDAPPRQQQAIHNIHASTGHQLIQFVSVENILDSPLHDTQKKEDMIKKRKIVMRSEGDFIMLDKLARLMTREFKRRPTIPESVIKSCLEMLTWESPCEGLQYLSCIVRHPAVLGYFHQTSLSGPTISLRSDKTICSNVVDLAIECFKQIDVNAAGQKTIALKILSFFVNLSSSQASKDIINTNYSEIFKFLSALNIRRFETLHGHTISLLNNLSIVARMPPVNFTLEISVCKELIEMLAVVNEPRSVIRALDIIRHIMLTGPERGRAMNFCRRYGIQQAFKAVLERFKDNYEIQRLMTAISDVLVAQKVQ